MPLKPLSLFTDLFDLILPPLCQICGRISERNGICHLCLEGLERIEPPFCTICGEPFRSKEALDHPCPQCLKSRPPFRKARSYALYRGVVLDAIHALKFRGRTSLAAPLSEVLSLCDVDLSEYDLIVPVPLHLKRLRERGYNQALLLARALGRRHSIEVAPRVLKKVRETPPQVGLKRDERIRNVKDAFEVTDPFRLSGKGVLLIDDVYTTGATVRECAKTLKRAGAGFVDVLTVARAKGDLD